MPQNATSLPAAVRWDARRTARPANLRSSSCWHLQTILHTKADIAGGGEICERVGAECEEAGFVARPEPSKLPLGEQRTRAGRAPDIEQCDIAEHTESLQVVDLSGTGLPRLVASRRKHDSRLSQEPEVLDLSTPASTATWKSCALST